MARFDRLTVLNTIVGRGIMTLFHDEDLDTVIEAATAVHAGGGRIFEFTNRVEHALDIFGELVRHAARHLPDLIRTLGCVSARCLCPVPRIHGDLLPSGHVTPIGCP